MMIRFLLASLFVGNLAQALNPNRVICATYELTTSYTLEETPTGFLLHVLHHNGVDYMPIHSGVITRADLAILAENAQVLNQMGAQYTIPFGKTECMGQGEQWLCAQRTPTQIGHLKVESIWFKVNKRRLETPHIKYEYFFADFTITHNGRSYSSPMEYPWDQCSFR